MKAIYTANEALKSANALKRKVEAKLGDYLAARSEGKKEAVIDFMFEYYRFRPSKLMQWSPGIGVSVEMNDQSTELLEPFPTVQDRNMLSIDIDALPSKRLKTLDWMIALQEAILERPPIHSCYGLHEWAMLYKSENPRHPYLKYRIPSSVIDQTVEQSELQCTHFDAYRFFTEQAVSMNQQELSRQKMLEMEQGGCIHNNMDLYKWAFKFYPWVDSDFIWECFEFALDARIVDMEASPYDVQPYGYGFIPIETIEGRKLYAEKQRALAERAKPLRAGLIKRLQSIQEFEIKHRSRSNDRVFFPSN